MEVVPKEELQDVDDLIYQDGPVRARRRQSDAKWRASVATCYDTLRHVVPKGHSVTKRKISKAVILQESERHIVHLENTLNHLINSDSQAQGKTVFWKGKNQSSKCTLKNFQDDFVKKQHKIFHSSNQGRRCYNLLDEIKEEIFSMSVDPDNISIFDRESVSACKCVDKVSGKEISMFSQMPFNFDKKGSKTEKSSSFESTVTQKKKIKYFETCPESFVASKTLAHYFEKEDQTVPSLPLSAPNFQRSSDTPCETLSSKSTFSSFGQINKPLPLNKNIDNESFLKTSDNESFLKTSDNESFLKTSDNESFLKTSDNESFLKTSDNDNDQTVPCLETTDNAYQPPGDTNNHFLGNLSHFIGNNPTTSTSETDNKQKTDSFVTNLFSTHTKSDGADDLRQDSGELKTPCNDRNMEIFKTNFFQKSNLLDKPLMEKRTHHVNRPTARKLNFTQHDPTAGFHQGQDNLPYACSPMLSGFTPVNLPPNITSNIIGKPPLESLISPWKAFNSPADERDKPSLIDLDNSLFCLETMDSILGDDERTPSLHSPDEDKSKTHYTWKRKILFDVDVYRALQLDKCHSKLESCLSNDEAQVVPDHQQLLKPQTLPDGKEGTDLAEINSLYNKKDDSTDFDGFFFYLRQIGHQLKQQQKVSSEDLQSPTVSSKVLSMWLKLPSPDKQTIRTLAILESRGISPGLQVKMGDLSRDLQDVDVIPMDLHQFIPDTPVTVFVARDLHRN